MVVLVVLDILLNIVNDLVNVQGHSNKGVVDINNMNMNKVPMLSKNDATFATIKDLFPMQAKQLPFRLEFCSQ